MVASAAVTADKKLQDVAVRQSEPVESAKRYPELDGLRGIACLSVILWHLIGASLTSDYGAAVRHDPEIFKALVPAMLVFGTGGVDLFFVLSGFLISGILMDNRQSKRLFQTFYLRRVCRILPVYFLVYGVLLACIVSGIASIPRYKAWLFSHLMPLWSYPIFLQNVLMSRAFDGFGNFISMTWSVAVEEQFYLFFPLVVFLLPPRRLPLFCLLSIVVSCICREVLPSFGWWFYPLLICRFDALAVGILCAIAIRDKRVFSFFRQKKGVLAAIIGTAFISILLSSYVFRQFEHQHFIAGAMLYGGCLMFVLCHKDSWGARLCRLSWLRKMGLISYAAYMFHQGINGFLHATMKGQPPTLQDASDLGIITLSFALTILLSALSYRFIESPCLAFGKRARWS